MTTKWIRLLACCLLALGLAAPALAWDLNDSEEPGSVIVFHKFINDVESTQFEISATCPKALLPPNGPGCQINQNVYLKAHWVCPGQEINEEFVCPETDFNLTLTVFGTVVFDAQGNGAPVPPCDRGYLIAWVIDDPGTANAIKYDSLIGDAVIKTSSSSARAYNALPIQAAEWINTGDRTDGNGPVNGALDFDGSEYKAITGKIFGNVRYEELNSNGVETSLTLLTLDVRSSLANPTTNVGLLFYNENEDSISTFKNFTCWTQDRLTSIDSNLDTNFGGYGATKGLVESTYARQNDTPVTLVGIVETEERFSLPASITFNPPPVAFQITVPTVPIIGCAPGVLPPGGVCQQVCIPSGPPGPVGDFNVIFCTVDPPPTTQFTNVFGTRDWAYSLYHDSTPVPTTFAPAPPPAPPQ